HMHYLVTSAHGYLGAVCFSSPSLQLKDRDEWVGWSDGERSDNQRHVANLSRLLIRPEITCRNLASRVLGLAVKQVRKDWKEHYHIELYLLETFVHPNFSGTCFQAANWEKVGMTSGRVRNSNPRCQDAVGKAIYLLPLSHDFRKRLCSGRQKSVSPREISDDGGDWISLEFGGCPLGDQRLSSRVEKVASAKWGMPSAGFPQLFPNFHQLKGAYRLFGNDKEEVNVKNLLAPHFGSTVERMANEKTVLAVSDTTTYNYNGLKETTGGLCRIGKNGQGESFGLVGHGTLAFTESGLPLGVLDSSFVERKRKSKKEKVYPHLVPIEDVSSGSKM
ncbi:MAG: Druantia anti-phage system protein DruA, partial [Nitrospinota bacterium]